MRSTPLVLCALLWAARPAVTINLAQGTDRERQTKALLEQVLDSYDLSQVHLYASGRDRGAGGQSRISRC